jgi:preprotein translocase subunit SecY
MIKKLTDIWQIKDLRGKIIFTMVMLLIYRFGTYVPVPGIDLGQLKLMFDKIEAGGGAEDKLASMLLLFTGGAVLRFSIFLLGIMPYISASIIMQVMTFVYAPLKKLQEEGPAGQNKIKNYTKFLTVGICIVQGFMMINVLLNQQNVHDLQIILYPDSIWWKVLAVTAFTAGGMFILWLGDQISYRGIGNGASLIIMAGIVIQLPPALISIFSEQVGSNTDGAGRVMIIFTYIAMIVGIVLITLAQRRIPIQMAKHVRGMKMSMGEKSFLPLRVNQAGVMPVIFAAVVIQFLNVLFALNMVSSTPFMHPIMATFDRGLVFGFVVLKVTLVIFFSYFWTAMQFNPKEMAENLKKQGHFIPGIRPGKHTSDYLEKVMTRIVLAGAVFLAFIDISPALIEDGFNLTQMVTNFMGGTGLLIVVGVALDLMQKLDTELTMRNYEGFATKKPKRRVGRRSS